MKASDDHGFSLFEMLVAMAIVALATAAIFASPFALRRETSPELVARQIAARLNLSAASAVATGKNANVEIDVKSHTVSANGGPPLHIPEDFKLRLRTGLELLASEEKGSILFLADGTSSGGEIRLASPAERPILIRINWVTGAVSLARTD